jgi:hypothetical protein
VSTVLGRVIILAAFGAILIGFGEWQSRRDGELPPIPTGQDRTASALTVSPVRTVPAAEARMQAVHAAALDYTELRFPSRSRGPEVVYSRLVTPDEFPGIGITWQPTYGNDDPSMWIVLVHGDMEAPSKAIVGSPAEPPRLDFVLYLVDEVYGVRYSRLAAGGYGLGCLFNESAYLVDSSVVPASI